MSESLDLEPQDELLDLDSLKTPQFTNRLESFRYSEQDKEDSLEELSHKYTSAIRKARDSGTLNLNRLHLTNSIKFALADLGLVVEHHGESPTDLQDEIVKLREETEDALNSVKQAYTSKQHEIARRLSTDEELPVRRRDQSEDIEDTMVSHSPIIPFTPDMDEKMLSSINSLEDLRRFEKWRTEEVNKLREEVARLKRKAHESVAMKASRTSLSRNSLVSMLKEALHEEDSAEVPEPVITKASEAVKDTCEKELQLREVQLKAELTQQFKEEKEALEQRYAEQIDLAISETQDQLNKLWQRRIQSLENRLRYGAEHSQNDLVEEIVSFYQNQLEERLEEERVNLRKAMDIKRQEMIERLGHSEAYGTNEQRLRGLPKQSRYHSSQQISSRLSSEASPRDYSQADQEIIGNPQSQIEQEFVERLTDAKEAWKQRLSEQVVRELKQRFDAEHTEALATAEEVIKEEASLELESAVQHIRAEAQDAVTKHVLSVNEHASKQLEKLKATLFEECMQELSTGEEIRAQEQQALRTRAHIERELKNELRAKLTRELRAKCEEELRQKVWKAEEAAVLSKRKHLVNDSKLKVKAEAERLEQLQSKDVKALVEERVNRQQRELRQCYKQKLEQLKRDLVSSLENELEDRLSLERQDLRDELIEISQIKTALNSQLKKTAAERREELERIRQEERGLVSKLEEVEVQLQKLQETSYLDTSKDDKGQSPGRGKERPLSQQSTLFPQKELEDRPRAQASSSLGMRSLQISGAPSILQSQERPFEEPKTRTPKRLLSHYDSSTIVAKLIEKNMQEAARQTQRRLSPSKTYETPKSSANIEQHKEAAPRTATPTKPRHRLYAELLSYTSDN
jgi:hypothetical protein